MVTMSSSESIITFSDAAWLPYLTSERRSNLLVSCDGSDIDEVATRLWGSCTDPVQTVRLPGELALPENHTGPLLLWDAARLTLDQQINLNDWIGLRRGRGQVISVTSAPLLPLIENGRFLEGLYYRLNVVSLSARGW